MRLDHYIVYAEDGVYAGWPANHGAWQWGDEFLVGFMRGPYSRKGNGMHRIGQPYEKVLARSNDGGRTWNTQKPVGDFTGIDPMLFGMAPGNLAAHMSRGEAIIRVCGVYDTGGEDCDPAGAFYLSGDRGRSWIGPWGFDRLDLPEGEQFTGRTRTDGSLIFATAGFVDAWGTDYAFVLEAPSNNLDGFRRRSIVLSDESRAACPAVARLGSLLVCALRRSQIGKRACWIDVVRSTDEGRTWSTPIFVGSTGGNNGNPPALLALHDGRLLAAYGNRDEGSIVGALSDDGGLSWSDFLIRAPEGGSVDIGYPQLFRREDGAAVCVYYWTSKERPIQHIAATEVRA